MMIKSKMALTKQKKSSNIYRLSHNLENESVSSKVYEQAKLRGRYYHNHTKLDKLH